MNNDSDIQSKNKMLYYLRKDALIFASRKDIAKRWCSYVKNNPNGYFYTKDLVMVASTILKAHRGDKA